MWFFYANTGAISRLFSATVIQMVKAEEDNHGNLQQRHLGGIVFEKGLKYVKYSTNDSDFLSEQMKPSGKCLLANILCSGLTLTCVC